MSRSSLMSVTLWTLLSCLGFVFDGILIRIFTQHYDAVSISFYRMFSGAVVILLLLMVNKIIKGGKASMHFSPKAPLLSYVRILIATLGHVLWVQSFATLPFTEVATFKFMSPLISTLVGLFLLKDRINIQQVGGVMCLFLGIFSLQQGSLSASWSYLYPFCAVLSLVLCHVLGKKVLLRTEISPMEETIRYLVGASIVFSGALIYTNTFCFLGWAEFLALGVSNALAYYGLHYGLGHGSFYYVMSLGCFRWIISLSIGIVYFGEPLTVALMRGSLAVCLGLGCMIWSENRRRRLKASS